MDVYSIHDVNKWLFIVYKQLFIVYNVNEQLFIVYNGINKQLFTVHSDVNKQLFTVYKDVNKQLFTVYKDVNKQLFTVYKDVNNKFTVYYDVNKQLYTRMSGCLLLVWIVSSLVPRPQNESQKLAWEWARLLQWVYHRSREIVFHVIAYLVVKL